MAKRSNDPRVRDYYAQAERWPNEQRALRRILLASRLSEDFKWRSPCYTFEGANVATVWGLNDGAALSFFKGVLLPDPQALLRAPGKHSQSVRLIRFQSRAEIKAHETMINDWIEAAIHNEVKGLKVEFSREAPETPKELLSAFRSDKALKQAFAALTPGRRRGYLLHFGAPKQSETRSRRIAKHRDRILAGKGMHDR